MVIHRGLVFHVTPADIMNYIELILTEIIVLAL